MLKYNPASKSLALRTVIPFTHLATRRHEQRCKAVSERYVVNQQKRVGDDFVHLLLVHKLFRRRDLSVLGPVELRVHGEGMTSSRKNRPYLVICELGLIACELLIDVHSA